MPKTEAHSYGTIAYGFETRAEALRFITEYNTPACTGRARNVSERNYRTDGGKRGKVIAVGQAQSDVALKGPNAMDVTPTPAFMEAEVAANVVGYGVS